MRKLLMMLTLFLCTGVQAQENQYLRELTEAVKGLRKADSKVRDQFITQLSEKNNPKITLMDDVICEGDEFKGAKANRFRLNQSVVYVYGNQNPSLTSKDDGMLSSKERGIYYSAIEYGMPQPENFFKMGFDEQLWNKALRNATFDPKVLFAAPASAFNERRRNGCQRRSL